MATESVPELPFIAYKGSDPFAFVSYSHADGAIVYPELQWLADQGVNVWYDEGISPGHVWPRELAQTIDRCDLFVIYLTMSTVASEHCLRELHFAMQHGKPVLAIYLEDLLLPGDWEFAIGDRQGIMKKRLPEDMYRQKLRTALAEYLPIPDVPDQSVVDGAAPSLDGPGEGVPEPPTLAPARARPMMTVAGVVLILVLLGSIGGGLYLKQQQEMEESARAADALSRISELVASDDYGGAYEVAVVLEAQLGTERVPQAVWDQVTVNVDIKSEPQAEVSYRVYGDPSTEWIPVGTTPMEQARLPRTMLMLRFEKEGYASAYRAAYNPGIFTRNAAYEAAFLNDFSQAGAEMPQVELLPASEVPEGMIPIPGMHFPLHFPGFSLADSVDIPRYLIDRLETTNAEYHEFVKAGGYSKPEYWDHLEFIEDGSKVDWDDAVARFVDTTGRAGPASWELGRYPTGAQNLPVHGISWYEASAYARFRNKSLPTMSHWVRAAIMPLECCEPIAPRLTELSNFGGSPIEVGSSAGVGPYGTIDMAGNVAEWVQNSVEDKRLVMGGSASDPVYLFFNRNRLTPWSRNTLTGVRLVKYTDAVPDDLYAAVDVREPLVRPEPASDEVLEAVRRAFDYVPFARKPIVESEQTLADGSVLLRHVTFRTGQGEERFSAYIFLPTEMAPPYQPVIYMSGYGGFASAGGIMTKSFNWQVEELMDPLLRTGRAVIWPEWYGSYSRYDGLEQIPEDQRLPAWMSRIGQWRQEYDGIAEYVRGSDELNNEMAYLGLSFGASVGAFVLTFDDAIKSAVLLSGGYRFTSGTDIASFMKVQTPILMLNARYDYLVPMEQAQMFYDNVGTPEQDKRLVIYDTGHWPLPRHQMSREMIDWLDRYHGPIE